MELTHLSLFTGIGGLDLAAEWAGFQTVGQCEWAEYPTKVLEKHWPDVPRWRDIRSLTYDNFKERTGMETVDVISGGFPCQPFSVAGKQQGKEDERYLWPEMLRVIREIAPSWVVGENVPGILRIAADDVCKDLEHEGYEVGIFNFEAAAVGAIHRRDRVFFVANSKRNKHWREKEESCCGQAGRVGRFIKPLAWNTDWESALCEFRRMDDGLSYRVDRLNTLRNAVVPQQAYPIFKAIAEIKLGN
jgi:DNA (cytosine-5)-methyltransferase 1